MNIFNIKTTYLFILFIAITACSDSFVDVPSKNPSADNFFNTEEDFGDILIGAYDLLQATSLANMVTEIASDNTLAGGDPETSDQPIIQAIDIMGHEPSNAQLRDVWRWMYAGLNRTNYFLEFKDNPVDTEFDKRNDLIGQVYFLRAYFTFTLSNWYGAIPLKIEKRDGVNRIIDERIKFGDEKSLDKPEKQDSVFALAERDLKEAITLLDPTKVKGQIPTYEVTTGAAQALLGKIHLFRKNFQAAADVLDNVINSGKYSLVPHAELDSLFEHNWENNSEAVFEIQYTDVEGADFGCLQCSEGNVMVGFSGVRDIKDHPQFDTGYGFNTPTQETYDAFEADDKRRNMSILDMRNYTKGFTPSAGETKLYNRKYLPRKGDIGLGDHNLTNSNNYRAIRYSDVLLMAAEAHAEISNTTKAADYLNQVRARAFGNNNHDYPYNGETDLLEAIHKERRLELVGEGHRFFDLVRTGKAAEKIEGFTPSKNEVFPIPPIELELMGQGENWQNPGY